MTCFCLFLIVTSIVHGEKYEGFYGSRSIVNELKVLEPALGLIDLFGYSETDVLEIKYVDNPNHPTESCQKWDLPPPAIIMKGDGKMHNNVDIRDLSEQTKTKDMIQSTCQHYVIGQLAASIAHEIRNSLTAIKGFTQLSEQGISTIHVDLVMLEIEMIEEIINDLLVVAKPQISTLEELDMLKILGDSMK